MMNADKITKFAAVDRSTNIVYGLGLSREAAMKDSEKNLEGEEVDLSCLFVMYVTDKAYTHIKDFGGDCDGVVFDDDTIYASMEGTPHQGLKEQRVTALNNVISSIEEYGADVMSKLDEEGAARLALYLLDQAGMSIEDQTKVLNLILKKHSIQTEY